jgi:hypothetical protein
MIRKPAPAAVFVILAAFLLPFSATAIDLSAPLPKEVISDNGWGVVQKIYELPKDEDRTKIPITDIDVGGITYTCTDVLHEEIAQEDVKEYGEVFTAESKTDDEITIASVMPPEREVKTNDGYEGIITLDPASVKAEPTGYNSASRTVSVTREYPNQASQDIEHLPKEVEESGRKYALVMVDWKTDNTYNADDYEVGDRYTAIVTYSREAISQTPKGFTVTGSYSGAVTRAKDALLRYTVIFTRTGAALVSPSPNPAVEPGAALGQTGADSQSDGNSDMNGDSDDGAEAAEDSESSGASSRAAVGTVVLTALILGGAATAAALVLSRKGIITFGRGRYYDDSHGDDN